MGKEDGGIWSFVNTICNRVKNEPKMTASNMLRTLQNPSQAGEEGSLPFGLLFFLSTHCPFICAMLNGGHRALCFQWLGAVQESSRNHDTGY